MPHGYADYGGRGPKSIVHSLFDLGELAVRISGVNSVDRLGDVYFFDEFASGLGNWLCVTSGTGGAYALSGAIFKSKGWSLKLTTGSTASRDAYAVTVQPYTYPSKMGLELNISMDANSAGFSLYVTYYNGVNSYYLEMNLQKNTGVFGLYNELGAWQQIASGLVFTNNTRHFLNLKVVIDMSTQKYDRLILDGVNYDLTAYGMQVFTSATARKISFMIDTGSIGVSNGISYLDSVILTQNEP